MRIGQVDFRSADVPISSIHAALRQQARDCLSDMRDAKSQRALATAQRLSSDRITSCDGSC